jgi:hypothetical protein
MTRDQETAEIMRKWNNPQSGLTLRNLHEIHDSAERFLFFDEPGNGVLMRHDVDDDLDKSLSLAYIQARNGWKATYFILTTAPYWTKDRDLWSKCRDIQTMGHRVEWHNDCITEAVLTKRTPKECAAEKLQMFRDNGIPVTGSASHGNSLCHKLHYINYQAFAECQEQSGPMGSILGLPPASDPFPMSDLGLLWESYHVPHDTYYSEPGGIWKNKPDLEVMKTGGQRIQVLIHPQWWPL